MRTKSRQALAAHLAEICPPARGRVVPADVWDRLSERQRIETVTGRSLDNCMEVLDLPMELAITTPCVMQGKVGVIRAVLTAVTKVGIESKRLEGMQQEVLGGLIRQFEESEAEAKSKKV